MNIFNYKNVLPLLLLLVTGTAVSARGKHHASGEVATHQKKEGIDFIENKGQWVPEAKFSAGVPGGSLFLTNHGFVYHYISEQDMENAHQHADAGKDASQDIIHHYAYKVNFVGANSDVKYQNLQKRSNYNNYFIGNDQSKWASNVGLYGKVIQQNVYNGVDLAIYSKSNSLKYDFIVAAGANPAQIVLSFDGITPEILKNGDLRIKTSVNEVIEQAPYTYQVVNGKQVAVKSQYKMVKGQLTFEFPEGYDNTKELVIDPTLVFATFSGGGAGGSNFYYAHSTTYDDAGNTYAGALAYNAAWPTTTGAFQSTLAGGVADVAINKYNSTGSNLVYSTYYGGSGVEMPNVMRVNSSEELVVAGATTSPNLPYSTGAYDNTLGGSSDLFVVHFNSTGTALIGATLIGGASNECSQVDYNIAPSVPSGLQGASTSPCELYFDNAGNILVASNTNSSDFPVTTNAVQGTIGGGYDGFLIKLNPTCTNLMYSTFLGGTNTDAAYNIGINSAGNVVVCGGTQSTNFPVTTGAYKTTAPGGSWDGFLCIINTTATSMVRSTYLGTDNTDNATKLMVDENDNIYVLGNTAGNYPITTGAWNMAGTNIFIDKINPTLSSSLISTRIGTTQGGSNTYLPTAFLLDICGNIYVAGLTGSTGVAGMPLTADAFDVVPKPFWFCAIQPNFSALLFGTYFGVSGEHAHTGTSRFDPQGVVYHSVCATLNTFPTTPGSWSPVKQNLSANDIISFKFDFEATGVQSNFILDAAVSGNDTGCVPYTVHFVNNSTSAEVYTWNFGDGSPTSNLAAPTHIYTVPGVYTVSLHANNDSSCITDDTAYMTITVLQTTPPVFTVNDTTLCTFSQAVNIGLNLTNPSPNNTILWQPASGILTSPTLPQITVDPSINNVYWVTVKDTIPGICGFSATDTVHIDLSPRVLDIINNDTVVCEGAAIPITAVGTTGYTYVWYPATGVSNTNILNPIITINQPNLYTLTASYPNCPDTSVQINFDMHFIPHLTVGPDQAVCQWTDVALESMVTPFRNDYIYQWTPVTANLSNANGPNTHFIADSTITYHLNVQTPIGCSDDDSVKIIVYPGAFGAISSDTGYCPGNEAHIWATGGTSYSWTPSYGLSDSTVASPVANPQTTTEYTVLITNMHNCTDTEKVTVRVYPEAILTLPDSVTVYPGEQYHVEPGTNGLYFSWFPPSGLSDANISDPLMSPVVRTRYFVTATTENGCKISDSMDVLVKETVLDMPNAFTPSSTNNLFKPSKRGIAHLKSFTIFNRWGNKVYSSTNIDAGWDGTYNGKVQPMGVYIYTIEAVTDSGQTFTRQGNVTLIR